MLRRDAGPFDDLLDIDAIEVVLTDLGRRPAFRLVRDGVPVPVSDYTVRTRVGGTDIDDVAHVDRILELVAGGATVVMQGLQRSWTPLARFCLDVEAELGHPVQANAYLSPPSAAGLASHADTHDVLVLQVTGSKQWNIGGLGDVTIAAGDVLYLPAGTRHAARTATGPSLHITLGLLTTTMRDVLRRAVDGIDDDVLDRPLPIGYPTAAIETTAVPLAQALDAVIRHFGDLDAAVLTEREIARRNRRRRRRWTGRLGVVVDPSTVSSTTLVERRQPFTLTIDERDADRVVLRVADRVLRLPAIAADALRCLQTTDGTRVGDLPGLSADDRHTLVRRLVREGVIGLAVIGDGRC
jgi:hypothetical protein